MKRLICLSLAALALLPLASPGAQDTYDNHGFITVPPVIDATNFINHGQFSLITFPKPFETFSTLNYTNYGSMGSQPGWRFETTPPDLGGRHMAANFVNFNPGVVQAVDPFVAALNLPCLLALYDPSFVFISATNIITGAGVPASGASVIVGANGWLQLIGSQVDVSDSGLEVVPVWNEFNGTFTTVDRSQFQPDIAIFDQYWVQAAYSATFALDTGALWNGFAANAPGVPRPPSQPVPTTPFPLLTPDADSYIVGLNPFTLTLTNIIGTPTNVLGTNLITLNLFSNLFKGAAFASAPSNFRIDIGFLPSQQPNLANFFQSVSYVFTTQLTNVVNGQFEPATIFVWDTLASDGRFRGLSTNIIGCETTTFRPRNYFVDRTGFVLGGGGNNGYPDPNFFTKTGEYLTDTNVWIDTVTNAIVRAGDFAGYEAFFDNLVTRPSPVAFGNDTNAPGRVRIYADNLNLENARIRGEGQIYLQTKHLVSSRSAVIDCESISLNLGSTNESLTVESVVPNSVQRLRGPIFLWSAVWTNQAILVFTNNYIFSNAPIFFPPGSTNIIGSNVIAILAPVTNNITMGLTATMADGDALQSQLGVTLYELVTKGNDVIFNDTASVVRNFKIDARSFTLNGAINIPGSFPVNPLTLLAPPDEAVQSWNADIAPNLRFFTNNGTLTVFSEARFGDDRAFPYNAFVNNGTITAAGITASSAYYENRGTLITAGAIQFNGTIGKMENGNSSSGNVSSFTGSNVKFNRYSLTANGPLIFNVTNSLADAGPASANTFRLLDGYQLNFKPQLGDLLGTTIEDVMPLTPSIHGARIWAGEDRGASAGGFTNNAAIGQLVLSSQSARPLFRFFGAGAQNGLYVDVLDLSALTAIDSQIQIAANLTIYYAAARLGFTPPPDANGIPQQPEEYLNGRFGGRLRWVPSYAGPNSSRPVVINGQTYYVNKALADSKIIDSDGDGVPNYFDAGCCGDTFAVAPISVNVVGNGQVTPNYNGQKLILGLTYTLFAQPGEGAVFNGWTGSVTTSSPQATFVMTTNLSLTANFSFSPVTATYNGLFYQNDAVRLRQSGSITATTTKNGSYSGSLTLGGSRYSFKGVLNGSGRATNNIPRSGNTTLTVALQAGNDHLTGAVTDGSWIADITATRSLFNAKTNPAPQAGKYTVKLPGSGDVANTAEPLGDSFGTVNVDKGGKIAFSASLADNAKASQSSILSQDGQWPLYLSLNRGKGQMLGWMNFETLGNNDLDGTISWIKEPNATERYYSGGFDLDIAAVGSAYNPALAPLTGFADGQFTLTGGNLASSISSLTALSAANKLTDISSNKLSIKFSTGNGLFSGSILNRGTGKSVKFNGIVLQRQQESPGFFLGTNQTGRVEWKPTP